MWCWLVGDQWASWLLWGWWCLIVMRMVMRRWTESGVAMRTEFTSAPSGFPSLGSSSEYEYSNLKVIVEYQISNWILNFLSLAKTLLYEKKMKYRKLPKKYFQGSHFLSLWLGLCWICLWRWEERVACDNNCDIPFIYSTSNTDIDISPIFDIKYQYSCWWWNCDTDYNTYLYLEKNRDKEIYCIQYDCLIYIKKINDANESNQFAAFVFSLQFWQPSNLIGKDFVLPMLHCQTFR